MCLSVICYNAGELCEVISYNWLCIAHVRIHNCWSRAIYIHPFWLTLGTLDTSMAWGNKILFFCELLFGSVPEFKKKKVRSAIYFYLEMTKLFPFTEQ